MIGHGELALKLRNINFPISHSALLAFLTQAPSLV